MFASGPFEYGFPRSSGKIVAAASALGIDLPPACMSGVIANLVLLAKHASILAQDATDVA